MPFRSPSSATAGGATRIGPFTRSGVIFESLTAREQEVIGLVTAGLMNKQIAVELGVSEITVKVHRGNVMKKMGARSLADLVRMADLLGIRRAKP